MANTKNTKAVASVNKSEKPVSDKSSFVEKENITPESTPEQAPAKQEKLSPKEIDLNQYITVRNGFQGKLVYKSSKTGEKFVWEGFGDEQEIDLRELRNAKSSAKRFFSDNWFMFSDEFAWVIDFLGIRQYYKNAVSIEEFDALFDKEPEELADIISELSEGQKKSLAYRALELISSDKLDSRKKISMLEETLGVELIEK